MAAAHSALLIEGKCGRDRIPRGGCFGILALVQKITVTQRVKMLTTLFVRKGSYIHFVNGEMSMLSHCATSTAGHTVAW